MAVSARRVAAGRGPRVEPRGLLIQREWPLIPGTYEFKGGTVEFREGQVIATPNSDDGLAALLAGAEEQGSSGYVWRRIPKLADTRWIAAIIVIALGSLSVGAWTIHNALVEKNGYSAGGED